MLFTVYQASQSVRGAFHFSCQNSVFQSLALAYFLQAKTLNGL